MKPNNQFFLKRKDLSGSKVSDRAYLSKKIFTGSGSKSADPIMFQFS
jgi:hypothetical protein